MLVLQKNFMGSPKEGTNLMYPWGLYRRSRILNVGRLLPGPGRPKRV